MEGQQSGLPPIKELFVECWEALAKSVLNLFLISLVAIFASIFLILLVLALFFASGLGKRIIDLFSNLNPLGSLSFQPLIMGVLAVLILLLVLAVIGIVAKVASILVVSRWQEKDFDLGQAFRQGFKLVIPLWVTNFLVTLLILGGVFFLILPGIFFGLLLMFAQYEVVLQGKKFFKAIKASMQIMLQNFGGIVGRLLLYFFLYLLIVFLIPGLARNSNQPAISATVSIMSFFINTLVGWFGLCYIITLYKQARINTDFEKKTGFAWVAVVALLGWTMVGAFGYWGIKALPNLKLPDQLPLEENMRPTYPQDFEETFGIEDGASFTVPDEFLED